VAGLLSDDSQELEKSRNHAEESFSKLNLSSSFQVPQKVNLQKLIKKAQGLEKPRKVVKMKRGRSETGTSNSSNNTSFAEKKKEEAFILELGR